MADDGVSEETKNQILQEQAIYGLCTMEQDIKKICPEAPEVKKAMENAINWENLPQLLLAQVLERLSPSDFLRFSCVCKPWLYEARLMKSELTKMTPPPMLLISSGEEQTWSVHNIAADMLLQLQISLPDKRYCGSSKGWLISVEKDFSVTLINPFFRVKGKESTRNSIFHLPPLPRPPNRRFSRTYFPNGVVFKATMTADPILNPDDCIVVVTWGDEYFGNIRLKDTTWTYHHFSVGQGRCEIHEVTHSLDKFYAIDQDEQIFSFGITAGSISDKELVVREPELIMFQPMKKYLVLSNDTELWMVVRHFQIHHGKNWTTAFDVFKANFEQGEWVEKDTLGDVTFFLGENCSISVPASKSGCKPDCIFYNHSTVGEQRLDFGVYFVKDRKLISHAGHLSRRKQDKLSQPYIRNARKLIVKANYPPAFVVPTCWL